MNVYKQNEKSNWRGIYLKQGGGVKGEGRNKGGDEEGLGRRVGDLKIHSGGDGVGGRSGWADSGGRGWSQTPDLSNCVWHVNAAIKHWQPSTTSTTRWNQDIPLCMQEILKLPNPL